jgi:hypothetical protein
MVNVIVTSLVVLLAASAEAGQLPQPVPAAPVAAPTADAQAAPLEPLEIMKLSGPRMGMTFLSPGVVRKLRYDIDGEFSGVGPVVSQFGWQWEKRFLSGQNGLTAVTEWAFLMGGLEQGVAIPSLSWLVGVRTLKGVEFAVGPNFTPAGAALAVAGGVTLRAGNLNFPLNLAVVPSKSGMRVSLLAGFNARQR